MDLRSAWREAFLRHVLYFWPRRSRRSRPVTTTAAWKREERRQRSEMQEAMRKPERAVEEDVRCAQQQQRQMRQDHQQTEQTCPASDAQRRRDKRDRTDEAALCPPRTVPEATRKRAHEAWLGQVADHFARNGREAAGEKPPHPTLDSCAATIAAAPRVGATSVALSEIDDEVQRLARLAASSLRRDLSHEEVSQLFAMVATGELDDDANTVMHYASYYENTVVYSYLMMYVGPFFPDVLLEKNIRGQVPADFCAVASSRSFGDMIDAATAHARKVVDERRPSAKLRKVLRAADAYRIAHLASAAALVGRAIMGRGWLLSLFVALAFRGKNRSLFAAHGALKLLPPLVSAWNLGWPPSLPSWVYLLAAGVILLRAVREIVFEAVLACFMTMMRLLEAPWPKSCLGALTAKVLTESQMECLELLVYSVAWYTASTLVVSDRF